MLLFRCHVRIWGPPNCIGETVFQGEPEELAQKREFLYNLYGKSRCPNPVTTPLPNIIETGIGREDV